MIDYCDLVAKGREVIPFRIRQIRFRPGIDPFKNKEFNAQCQRSEVLSQVGNFFVISSP